MVHVLRLSVVVLAFLMVSADLQASSPTLSQSQQQMLADFQVSYAQRTADYWRNHFELRLVIGLAFGVPVSLLGFATGLTMLAIGAANEQGALAVIGGFIMAGGIGYGVWTGIKGVADFQEYDRHRKHGEAIRNRREPLISARPAWSLQPYFGYGSIGITAQVRFS